jgi:hypothetical protein
MCEKMKEIWLEISYFQFKSSKGDEAKGINKSELSGNAWCQKKNCTTLRACMNLFREHVQCFELS